LKHALWIVLLAAPLAGWAQTNNDDRPLGKAEVYGSVTGVKFRSAPRWYPGSAFGLAVDILHRPQTPIILEYAAGAESATGSNLPVGHNYAGAGLRIHGVGGVFGSVSAGYGKVDNGPSSFNGVDLGNKTSGPALSIAGGSNIAIKPNWGIRAEARATGIHTAIQQWIFQVGGGLYYRLGKK
jgi:hypothetical protein